MTVAALLTRHPMLARMISPLLGACVLGIFVLLYHLNTPIYQLLLSVISSHPFPHPFIDWEWLPSAASCWAQGVDVYADNSCFLPVPHGRHAYSPLVLRASFLPTGTIALNLFGLGLAGIYLVALGFLPPPRGTRDLIVTALVACSSLVFFAIERGNIDLLIFAAVMLATFLWSSSLGARLAGYCVIGLVGAVKFYPLVLLALVMRERKMAVAAIAIASAAMLGAFVMAFSSELRLMLINIPKGSYFTDLFGAVNLPYGISTHVSSALNLAPGTPGAVALSVLAAVLFALLGFAVAWHGWWLATAGGLRAALAAIDPWSAHLLITGSLLLCGCFFAGQSVGYRGVMLVLVVPGLLRLSGPQLRPGAQRVVTATCGAIVLVGWMLPFAYGATRASAYGAPVRSMHWVLNELAWWWIIATLSGVIISFGLDTARRGTTRWSDTA